MKNNTLRVLLACTSAAIFIGISGCGTGTSSGTCKPARNSGYVAATTDADGSPWKMEIYPADVSQPCKKGTSGTTIFTAVIKDSLKIPKGGLSISGTVGTGDMTLTSASTNTDSCGTAQFEVSWTCPSDASLPESGTNLVVSSGALTTSTKFSVVLTVPTSSALIGETPN